MGLKDTWDSERDPLVSLRAGDPGPFEAFVTCETPTFLAFFGRLGATRGEAEDLAQEVFLKLFRTADNYRSRGRFAAYAFRVARNAWIDRRRRWAGQPEVEAVDLAHQGGEDEEPGAGLARREEVARLRQALAALPEHHRLVFELGVVQELPYGEIAEALEIPVGTVKSRMFHAVRKLREVLEEGGAA